MGKISWTKKDVPNVVSVGGISLALIGVIIVASSKEKSPAAQAGSYFIATGLIIQFAAKVVSEKVQPSRGVWTQESGVGLYLLAFFFAPTALNCLATYFSLAGDKKSAAILASLSGAYLLAVPWIIKKYTDVNTMHLYGTKVLEVLKERLTEVVANDDMKNFLNNSKFNEETIFSAITAFIEAPSKSLLESKIVKLKSLVDREDFQKSLRELLNLHDQQNLGEIKKLKDAFLRCVNFAERINKCWGTSVDSSSKDAIQDFLKPESDHSLDVLERSIAAVEVGPDQGTADLSLQGEGGDNGLDLSLQGEGSDNGLDLYSCISFNQDETDPNQVAVVISGPGFFNNRANSNIRPNPDNESDTQHVARGAPPRR
eukprot:TRINITY_DN2182_c0_g1_i3.p2 TRINITY_DN2182_c0_g1~~TRINITY_DN2182_c0_g1_i3.p2  ORF type:complete len:371 (+),score=-57.82 TRINITY_DN2182_c0_g1_i3:179-1291(+)